MTVAERNEKGSNALNNGDSDRKRMKRDKRKRREEGEKNADASLMPSNTSTTKKDKKRKVDKESDTKSSSKRLKHPVSQEIGVTERRSLDFDVKYILAPMVGASELAFRLLCRKYGAQLAYTPMMSSTLFARDESYRQSEFQTIPEDRPLVCHFSANNPEDFCQAAKLCESYCDAIDLNLGCPQRTAYVGHFGSYLLGSEDRDLVLTIVRAGVQAVSIPIFVKIRLLDTVEQTIELCQQLRDAGASLIAIHARYRANFERKGPGARDGPAMLDQITEIKRAVPNIRIIANGNVITYKDVVNNLELTAADGIMSAEGILDNPALFLPRFGSRNESDKLVSLLEPPADNNDEDIARKRRKLLKKLRKIEKIEEKIARNGKDGLDDEQNKKLADKDKVTSSLQKLSQDEIAGSKESAHEKPTASVIPLGDLYKAADDSVQLANEYLSLVRRYPITIRTVVFHTRRMLKDLLTKYQLMEECVACQTVEQVQAILDRCRKYNENPESFCFDRDKAALQKEALERKRREEGKRKAFEARMIRKAKREGKSDLEYYLRIGADVPSLNTIVKLKSLPREEQLQRWKMDHSQHCIAFHLDPGGCKRDRACAFLHSDVKGENSFIESDEVAG